MKSDICFVDVWVSVLDYMECGRNDKVFNKFISFLLDMYGGVVGWEIRHGYNEPFFMARKIFDFNKGISHNYLFCTSFLVPLDLKAGSCIEEYASLLVRVSLSGEFGKFIMQNMDKLNPYYKNDILHLDWKENENNIDDYFVESLGKQMKAKGY